VLAALDSLMFGTTQKTTVRRGPTIDCFRNAEIAYAIVELCLLHATVVEEHIVVMVADLLAS
jgi:hypothetical protein